jgi:hypothetical protein
MPPLAGIGAAIGGAVSAGAAALGTAVGGLTLGGLATGASIVGTGLQLVGMATGSKTLQKIGGGMSLVGGIGQGFGAVRGAMSGTPASSSSLLKGSGVDDVLSSNVKGALSSDDLINKSPLKGSGSLSLNSASNFNKASDAIDFNPDSIKSAASAVNPDTKDILQRIDNTLTRYSMPMNVIGGMGEAYMMKQQLDQRDRMQQRDLAMVQNAVDRRSQMPGQFNTAPGVQFNPNAYTPLLRN